MNANGSPTDWLSDYDIFDPQFVRDPYPVMTTIRESECPVAHSDRWGGSWMPTRYDDVVAAAQEYDIFTSRNIIVVPPPTGQLEGPYAGVAAPPITSDPPEHHWHRRTILPTFAPQAVAKYENGTRDLCNRLIDGFIDAGEADAAADYAQQIPVRVIAAMLGVPLEMADEFTSWVRGVLEIGLTDPKVRLESRMKILGFFRAQLDDRKAHPRQDDLITELLNTEVDGRPVSEEYVMGVCNLMLVAGIDTTWSAIGSSLWHLAQHPEHRQQLREQPEIWPTAIEELLRAYSPVTMARIVDRDTEFQGCPMHAGDRVLMSFPAANRDPRQFENPDEVILEPRAQPSRRVRLRHSPLRRIESRSPRTTRRVADLAATDPRLRAGRCRRCHLGWWSGPWPAPLHRTFRDRLSSRWVRRCVV